MGIEAILALAGLVVPPVVDFAKKKWIKREDDTMEATMSSLATTKPETIPTYLEALVKLIGAKIEWFNRDLRGTVHVWVNDLRASIRPITVIASLVIIASDKIWSLNIDPTTRGALLMNISSWFSDRIK